MTENRNVTVPLGLAVERVPHFARAATDESSCWPPRTPVDVTYRAFYCFFVCLKDFTLCLTFFVVFVLVDENRGIVFDVGLGSRFVLDHAFALVNLIHVEHS